jgi:hypothetical protein
MNLTHEEQKIEDQHDFDERAGIFEFDGGHDRETAERYARILIERKLNVKNGRSQNVARRSD